MTASHVLLRFAKSIFFTCGIWLIGLGAYFMFVRPALLPEDLRYLGLSAIQAAPFLARLASWLGHVFIVVGGFMAGSGVLITFISLRAVKKCSLVTGITLGLAGLLTVTIMSWTNFVIDSDFKWLLLVPAVAWWLGLIGYAADIWDEQGVVTATGPSMDAAHE